MRGAPRGGDSRFKSHHLGTVESLAKAVPPRLLGTVESLASRRGDHRFGKDDGATPARSRDFTTTTPSSSSSGSAAAARVPEPSVRGTENPQKGGSCTSSSRPRGGGSHATRSTSNPRVYEKHLQTSRREKPFLQTFLRSSVDVFKRRDESKGQGKEKDRGQSESEDGEVLVGTTTSRGSNSGTPAGERGATTTSSSRQRLPPLSRREHLPAAGRRDPADVGATEGSRRRTEEKQRALGGGIPPPAGGEQGGACSSYKQGKVFSDPRPVKSPEPKQPGPSPGSKLLETKNAPKSAGSEKTSARQPSGSPSGSSQKAAGSPSDINLKSSHDGKSSDGGGTTGGDSSPLRRRTEAPRKDSPRKDVGGEVLSYKRDPRTNLLMAVQEPVLCEKKNASAGAPVAGAAGGSSSSTTSSPGFAAGTTAGATTSPDPPMEIIKYKGKKPGAHKSALSPDKIFSGGAAKREREYYQQKQQEHMANVLSPAMQRTLSPSRLCCNKVKHLPMGKDNHDSCEEYPSPSLPPSPPPHLPSPPPPHLSPSLRPTPRPSQPGPNMIHGPITTWGRFHFVTGQARSPNKRMAGLWQKNVGRICNSLKEWKKRNRCSDKQPVFICIGGYPDMKKALQNRGWVENPDPSSKFFDFIWTLKATDIDFEALDPHQICNHFVKNREITTKVGLTVNLRNASWLPPVGNGATAFRRRELAGKKREEEEALALAAEMAAAEATDCE